MYKMKQIWEMYLSGNMVDVLIWLSALYVAIRYGVMKWKEKESATVGLFVLFLCFYGFWLIVRLGKMKFVIGELIRRCQEAGIDLSDILPE